MKSQLPWYALAAAIVVVGLAALKVPLSTLLIPLALLACPVMMIIMMRGMHGTDQRGGGNHEDHAGCGHQEPQSQTQPHRDTEQAGGR